MWDRYARGADAIVYVVDSADVSAPLFMVPVSGLQSWFTDETSRHISTYLIFTFDARRPCARITPTLTFGPTLGRHQRATIPTAASELHSLLAVQALAGVPLLVLANKNDLPEAMGVDEMIGAMGLERIRDRAVSVSTESPLPQL